MLYVIGSSTSLATSRLRRINTLDCTISQSLEFHPLRLPKFKHRSLQENANNISPKIHRSSIVYTRLSMAIDQLKGNQIPPDKTGPRRRKLGAFFAAEKENDYDDVNGGFRSFCVVSDVAASGSPLIDNSAPFYSNPSTTASSPYNLLSPWVESSPYLKSPWIHLPASTPPRLGNDDGCAKYGLIGSLVREEGHVYSIAAAGDLLYTGSDSKNIRVWKNFREYSGFKSSSGLLKAIVLYGDKVFTGHQDGKIRVWRHLGWNKGHRRVGSLPTVRDLLMKSVNPKNYVAVRRHRNVPWVKHYDAVSCLSIDADQGLLYSGSWDKSFKVWRISDSKCLESVQEHDDAVNAVAVGFDGLVFTGSADGTVKAWRRELVGPSTRHVLVDTLMRQDHALTSLAVAGQVLYAGSSDGLVSFWLARDGHFMSYGGALRGHKLAVLCLAAAEQLVLTGSADGSICVWQRNNSADGAHSCLTVLSGHTGPIKCLAVEEDARAGDGDRRENDRRWIVYSGSLDKTVKVWRVSER